jgi:hypothetical protein
MSLGGRAQRVAMNIPQWVLGQRNGLAILLARLEADIGSEVQDRVRQAGKNFERFKRPKGQNAADFIVIFENLYSEAVGHGLMMNRTLLSQKLIDAAGLSDHQETAVLQQVNGDYTRYEDIRRAIRRLPGLDSRHGGDAHAYYGDYESSTSSQSPQTQQGYNPFGNTLQRPPQESPIHAQPAYPASAEEFQEQEDDADWASASSDDWLSNFSDEEDAVAEQLAQAWVIHRRKRRIFRKSKGGGKGKFKRKHGKGGTWLVDEQGQEVQGTFAMDNKRNLSSEIPKGWEAAKWLKRTPCEDCGSRFHRSCKTFKGKGKGSKGGKGNKNGKGGSAFTTFLMASSLAFAPCTAYDMQCLPCFPCSPAFDMTTNTTAGNSFFSLQYNDDCFSNNACFQKHDLSACFQDNNCFQRIEQDSPTCFSNIACLQQTCFPYHAKTSAEADVKDLWVGYEPFEGREQRWSFLTRTKAKVRHGLLIDTGAPENAAGEEWIQRVTSDQGTASYVTWTPFESQLHGIGEGAAVCHHKAEIPIGLEPSMNTTLKTQVLSGCGSRVPGLLGLDSLIKRKAIIDLSDERNEQSYSIHFCDSEQKWQTLRIKRLMAISFCR